MASKLFSKILQKFQFFQKIIKMIIQSEILAYTLRKRKAIDFHIRDVDPNPYVI